MKIGFIMDTDYLTGHPEDSALLAQWVVKTSPHRSLYVVDDDQQLVGVIRLANAVEPVPLTLQQMMIPLSEISAVSPDDSVDVLVPLFRDNPEWSSIPVMRGNRLAGIVSREWKAPANPAADDDWDAVSVGQLYESLLDALYTGLIIVDNRGMTRLLNPEGAEILGVDPDEVVGQPYEELATRLFDHMRDYLTRSAVPLALTGAVDRGERELRVSNGRHVLFKFAAVREAQHVQAVLITFMDVTPLKHAEVQARYQERELEMAFALTLPNSKVEYKLKSSPEYQDIYDPATGQAQITGVIADGTYHHVINGLRIMAELKEIGVFQLVGIDKDTLVQAFIFHDVGKAQPVLRVGQIFVPQETFEPGYLHAGRSADWARKDYHVTEDVEWLVRYHHTPEKELPPTFPAALKPMWRVFKLVDGLSAGLTRRDADIAPMTLRGSVLTIHETNPDQRYDRHYRLAIYSGEIIPVTG